MIARESKAATLTTPTLMAVAMLVAVGSAADLSAGSLISGASSEAVAHRKMAAKWLGTITDAARRLHGDLPATMPHWPCTPTAAPIVGGEQTPDTRPIALPPVHVVLHCIDLPPPLI